jgi:diacylglycerol kinase (ATP)
VPDRVKIILNAQGGRLNSQAKLKLIEQGMAAAGLEYDLTETAYPNHGLELARQAAGEGWPVIVAAGGDGTVNEVVNGLMQGAGQSALGIIPFGSANDLADVLELPRDVTAACQRIAAKNIRLIDVGLVNDRYFVNNSAVGLEAMVAVTQDQMRYIRGMSRYVAAALKTILKAQSWSMRLEWDKGIFEGPVVLVSVGNSHRTGGAFYMTPQARLDDGLLDFIYALNMSRWQMLKLLPQTFSGKHVDHALIVYLQTKTLSITVTPVTPIQADGEIIDKTATHIHYQILPQKLQVII